VNRTAVVHILNSDGSPAVGYRASVEYSDGHYGWLPVFSGKVPTSGELIVKDITDRRAWDSPIGPYKVTVDDKPLGSFGFTQDGPSQEFVLRLVPGVGDIAPDVELVDVATGKKIKLSDLRGKVVLLEFWATWCGPCQPAMRKLSELAGEQAEAWRDRVALVGLSIDDEPDQAKQHVQRRGWDKMDHYWSGAEDSTGWLSPALRAFGGENTPEAILIDAEGRIRWRGHPSMDARNGETIKSRIEDALNRVPISRRLGFRWPTLFMAVTLVVFWLGWNSIKRFGGARPQTK